MGLDLYQELLRRLAFHEGVRAGPWKFLWCPDCHKAWIVRSMLTNDAIRDGTKSAGWLSECPYDRHRPPRAQLLHEDVPDELVMPLWSALLIGGTDRYEDVIDAMRLDLNLAVP
jgi:hypothetical protein